MRNQIGCPKVHFPSGHSWAGHNCERGYCHSSHRQTLQTSQWDWAALPGSALGDWPTHALHLQTQPRPYGTLPNPPFVLTLYLLQHPQLPIFKMHAKQVTEHKSCSGATQWTGPYKNFINIEEDYVKGDAKKGRARGACPTSY